MTEEERELLSIHSKEDAKKLGKKLGIKWRQVYSRKKDLIMNLKINSASGRNDLDEKIRKKILNQKEISLEEISNQFDVGIKHVEEIIKQLEREGYLINLVGGKIEFANQVQPPKPIKIDIEPFFSNWIRFGIVSDTHLNSKYERLDVLNALYDIFEREEIKNVFHAGNIIDGYAKFNMFDVIHVGVNEQIAYCIEKYPRRRDITTHFITGDDHEGWFVQREHINIGKVIEDAAINQGRHDLHHLGYIEADVHISIGKRNTILRIFHPGGGTAYAISYVPQKIIESMQGGEKPDFLIIGHTHKHEEGEVRNVPYIQAGCTEDQTPFMRKKHLEAHIGGWIIELGISDEGNIYRIKSEWIKFYNKDFYKNKSVISEKIERNWTYRW